VRCCIHNTHIPDSSPQCTNVHSWSNWRYRWEYRVSWKVVSDGFLTDREKENFCDLWIQPFHYCKTATCPCSNMALCTRSSFLDRFGKASHISKGCPDSRFNRRRVQERHSGFTVLLIQWDVLGPFTLLLLYYLNGNYRTIFLIAFIPALISVVLFIFYVSEKKVKKVGVSYKLSEFSRDFKIFILINIVFAIGNSSNVFLILRTKNIFETLAVSHL
jgi:hypothetical protein